MTITIEGYSVVVKKDRIADLIDAGKVTPPNRMFIADDHIWRCGFMAEADASEFLKMLGDEGLNVSQGPDSDAVMVSEFNQEVHPYCEWLNLGRWEKAILAHMVGTDPQELVVREGFDPKVGSGLEFHDRNSMEDLEFLRVDGNVEVYFNKKLNREVYIGRTSQPAEAIFKAASATIGKHFRTAGQPPLDGEDAEEVGQAVTQLGELLESDTDSWQVYFFHGKGMIALGKYKEAYASMKRAFELEQQVEAIPRELGGICLQLGYFAEAVKVGEKAVALLPDNAESLGNLAVNYLLAGNPVAAKKASEAALRIDPEDSINRTVGVVIEEVHSGRIERPETMEELSRVAGRLIKKRKSGKRKKRFWEFWKS